MYIVIDFPGNDVKLAVICTEENGENLVFSTMLEAELWAKENCAWSYMVVTC